MKLRITLIFAVTACTAIAGAFWPLDVTQSSRDQGASAWQDLPEESELRLSEEAIAEILAEAPWKQGNETADNPNATGNLSEWQLLAIIGASPSTATLKRSSDNALVSTTSGGTLPGGVRVKQIAPSQLLLVNDGGCERSLSLPSRPGITEPVVCPENQ